MDSANEALNEMERRTDLLTSKLLAMLNESATTSPTKPDVNPDDSKQTKSLDTGNTK